MATVVVAAEPRVATVTAGAVRPPVAGVGRVVVPAEVRRFLIPVR